VVRVDCTRVHLKGAIDGRSCSYLLHTSVMLLLAAYLLNSSCDSSLILAIASCCRVPPCPRLSPVRSSLERPCLGRSGVVV